MKKIIVFILILLIISILLLSKYKKQTLNNVECNFICNKDYKNNNSYKEKVTFNKDHSIEIIEYKKKKINFINKKT